MIYKSLDEFDPQKDKALKKLLFNSRVFTLSSDSGGGFGSCPLYFAYDDKKLVFLSSPNSHHIKSQKDISSASIFSDSKNLLSICGLQFKGNIRLATDDEKKVYLNKYPFVGRMAIKENFYTFCIKSAKLSNNALKDKIIFTQTNEI